MATAAGESCPQGPFETDREKIAAALTSLPTLPKTFGRERQSYTKPEAWTLTDGVASEGGGGLAPPVREGRAGQPIGSRGVRLEKLPCSICGNGATLRTNRLADERYLIRTVRPTVEQARDIACLVNQLLSPNVPPPKQRPAKAEDLRANPVEIVVIAPPRPCESQYTDGHWESLVLRVGGAQAKASPALSCGDALRLEACYRVPSVHRFFLGETIIGRGETAVSAFQCLKNDLNILTHTCRSHSAAGVESTHWRSVDTPQSPVGQHPS